MMILPSRIIFAYDEISNLSEENHREAHFNAFVATLNSINHFFQGSLRLKYIEDTWVDAKKANEVENLANALYAAVQDEEKIECDTNSGRFNLFCCADPVVFTLQNRNLPKP